MLWFLCFILDKFRRVREIALRGPANRHRVRAILRTRPASHGIIRRCRDIGAKKIEGGIFFFTVVVADRSSGVLVEEVQRLRQVYRAVEARLPFETNAICILPDHLHAIWTLPPGDADFASRWSQIKSGFSRQLPAAQSRSRSQRRRRETGIWQRRFWEHAIRGGADFERHVDYIHFNPVKHGYVTRVCDWPYSSFHRYVKNALLPADWGGDLAEIEGRFGE